MANDSKLPTQAVVSEPNRWRLHTTGKQVELLLHVAALVLVEWILFLFLSRSNSELPNRDIVAGGKPRLILIMVMVAVLWGVPLFFMLRHTRLTLRSCLVFVTVMACLMAGINYLGIYLPK